MQLVELVALIDKRGTNDRLDDITVWVNPEHVVSVEPHAVDPNASHLRVIGGSFLLHHSATDVLKKLRNG